MCQGSDGSNQINTTDLETRDELWKCIENQNYEKYDEIFQNINLELISVNHNFNYIISFINYREMKMRCKYQLEYLYMKVIFNCY